MDDDLPHPRPVPEPQTHTTKSTTATTIPSSSPPLFARLNPRSPSPFALLHPRYRAGSPTSSEPPLFSSDDGPDTADITNYQSPRNKKKRAGPWWTYPHGRPLERSKKTKISRNFDSGVFMMSDCSDASMDLASDPPETLEERLDRESQNMPGPEARLYREIHMTIEKSKNDIYDFERFGLRDEHLKPLALLNQVIYQPPDASLEAPSEGQYRPFIPNLFVALSHNLLCNVPPTLFEVDNIQTLGLGSNQIFALPPQIRKLKKANHIDLSHNHLNYLPVEFLKVLHNKNTEFKRQEDSILPTGNTFFILQLLGNPMYHPRINTEFDYFETASSLDLLDAAWEMKTKEVEDPNYEPASHHRFCPKRIRNPKNKAPELVKNTRANRRALKGPHLVLNGWSLVRYFDANGKYVQGSPTWPTTPLEAPNQLIPIDAIILTKRKGAYGVSSTWFVPPTRSAVPSLITRCLVTALQDAKSPTVVENYLGEETTPAIQWQLQYASINNNRVYSPLRQCHVCGKDYIVPRAEWCEFWMHSMINCVTVKVMVCSWGCVPAFIAERPEVVAEEA